MTLIKRILLVLVVTPLAMFAVYVASNAGQYLGEIQNKAFTTQIENSTGSEIMAAFCLATGVVIAIVVFFTRKKTN